MIILVFVGVCCIFCRSVLWYDVTIHKMYINFMIVILLYSLTLVKVKYWCYDLNNFSLIAFEFLSDFVDSSHNLALPAVSWSGHVFWGFVLFLFFCLFFGNACFSQKSILSFCLSINWAEQRYSIMWLVHLLWSAGKYFLFSLSPFFPNQSSSLLNHVNHRPRSSLFFFHFIHFNGRIKFSSVTFMPPF